MIGIVLAGGESRRFGSPKAFARHNGKQFYQYAMEALAPHCAQTIIVARPEHRDRFPDCPTVLADLPEVAGQGPLAGILTVMDAADSDWYAVLPCDVPFADDRIVELLTAEKTDGGPSAIEAAGIRHPLLSIWDRASARKIRSALAAGERSVRPLIRKWIDGTGLLEEDPSIFDNVNRPGQLEGR
ncbi:molybdenum cofactor guanylyltransferase [Sporosarcina trichiuri]|uniref:molybdenum cofactor guanylyltransferase n=1 Tax=Sporosarcina trichiuri TaxID=3056445 RepID=UPI0025B4C6DA|nr:molybdenum cofactor guanylyltransferase [Sporosarcina sp. 0.2-SM1T-5]WJY26621.1 molybdenum cofactor guanylyltransferase [Sporosarcina sp. 0.2-SM1T-5]